jgi:hypothetical protein
MLATFSSPTLMAIPDYSEAQFNANLPPLPLGRGLRESQLTPGRQLHGMIFCDFFAPPDTAFRPATGKKCRGWPEACCYHSIQRDQWHYWLSGSTGLAKPVRSAPSSGGAAHFFDTATLTEPKCLSDAAQTPTASSAAARAPTAFGG